MRIKIFLSFFLVLRPCWSQSPSWNVPENPRNLLQEHCLDCHEDGTEKGDIRLDNLAELSRQARMDLMNRVLEQVYLKQMPPRNQSKLDEKDREVLTDWVWRELHAHNASKLEEKMRYPSYGNYVDHETLFSGKVKDAPFTPARRWLINPMIFDERVRDVFELQGRDRNTPLVGVTNPFILPDHSGVRDYDIGLLDGGSLLVMLSNAEWIASKQIRPARVKAGEIGANDFTDPKDRWSPRSCPVEFEALILKKSPPTDDELRAAIARQFDLVLRRMPTEIEASKYLGLTREAVNLAGNSEGVRQMLKAILLESEFLYRQEWGAGKPDQHGRKILSPREAAYAISYAMGDLGPDAALLAAAAEGRLKTREDFHREVTRLLNDKTYYFGSIDPASNTGKVISQTTSHPRIIRFFRDFFGYPNAPKVFKDTERSHGVYQNADRGTLGTAGFLVDEADKIVTWCVEQDQNVFENLLSTDQYFVMHNANNANGKATIEKWRGVWEKLKDSEWKTDPEKVVLANQEYLKATLQIVPGHEKMVGRHNNTLTRCMKHFEASFGKGATPYLTFPWAHGNTNWHSPIYNLPPPSGKDGKYNEPPLDYHVEQPFRIAHRKGILTHPAWLVAHSQNTATDPVKRGRWIREKLLAGRVPDIPITVDAVIPEDHTKTLRSRLDAVTLKQECWKCHEFMNPLGLPFEMYDDFGRLRKEETLEHPENIIGKHEGRYNLYKTLPVLATGKLDHTGDPKLDGEVTDALDMIGRLAKAPRTRQSIIRHAFRFYMGRNEMLSDSQTLIDADKAYIRSGGSFRAVIISLLTSDSFLYRK
ncbi:MAG: hypothetical protein RLZZ553_985 [Verrucomicrobiota bacterium]